MCHILDISIMHKYDVVRGEQTRNRKNQEQEECIQTTNSCEQYRLSQEQKRVSRKGEEQNPCFIVLLNSTSSFVTHSL